MGKAVTLDDFIRGISRGISCFDFNLINFAPITLPLILMRTRGFPQKITSLFFLEFYVTI